MDRKIALQKAVKTENNWLSVSRYIEEKGIEYYNLVEQQKLEGIVAKRKDSLYYPGKKTKDWLKIKYMLDKDFIICGSIKIIIWSVLSWASTINLSWCFKGTSHLASLAKNLR